MPRRAKRPCKVAGCPQLTTGRYCEEHAGAGDRVHDQNRPSSARRGYGGRWRRLREIYLEKNPLCVDPFGYHKADGVIVPATDVDHIVPRGAGGSDAETNLQALCHSCHSRKTAIQSSGWGKGAESLVAESL